MNRRELLLLPLALFGMKLTYYVGGVDPAEGCIDNFTTTSYCLSEKEVDELCEQGRLPWETNMDE